MKAVQICVHLYLKEVVKAVQLYMQIFLMWKVKIKTSTIIHTHVSKLCREGSTIIHVYANIYEQVS